MRTKIVVFDFDGTLTPPNFLSTWQRVWANIPNGIQKDLELFNLWKNKKIDSAQWNNLTINAFFNYKLTNKTLDKIASDNSLLSDVEKVFNFLHKNNIEIHILSGGIKNIIEKILGNLIVYVKNINAFTLTFNSDNIINNVENPPFDPNNKHLYVQNLLKTKNLTPDEIFYVGNDWNDECVSCTKVTMLCINPNETNAKDRTIWNYSIEQTNSLADILPFIK
jgi:phosphoserine phosphatase